MSAEDIYKMWHTKDVDNTFKVKVPKLDEKLCYPVGVAQEILYRSAKWEKKEFDYVHDFGNPSLYFVESDVLDGEATGKGRSINKMLGVGSKKKQLPLALLGTVLEITYKNVEGELINLKGVKGAHMLSTPDKKGLLILAKHSPLLVAGGKMRVTARGIVD